MPPLAKQLIDDSCRLLGVVDNGPIGAPAGQKAVRLVSRAGQEMVLKIVGVSAAAPEAVKRAEREVELLSAMASPYVVKVASELVSIGDPVQGAAWLEEYLDGQDLGALLDRQWTWAETAQMALQVGRGLAVAHAQGVIHRDLSPNNVRRTSSGDFKVLDFGFARFTLKSGVTIHGQPGTPGFMSPEHINAYSGGPVPASDVFEVGILMYRALTGQNPTPYIDEVDYFHRLSSLKIPSIRTLRPDLESGQVDLISRCLHPHPARRYLNGAKLAEALEELL